MWTPLNVHTCNCGGRIKATPEIRPVVTWVPMVSPVNGFHALYTIVVESLNNDQYKSIVMSFVERLSLLYIRIIGNQLFVTLKSVLC